MKKIICIIIIFNSIFLFGKNPPAEIQRIINSGNGQSIKTAYQVYSIDEEYELMRYLNLKPVMQKLYIEDGIFYDALITNTKTIYFKLIKNKKINKTRKLIV